MTSAQAVAAESPELSVARTSPRARVPTATARVAAAAAAIAAASIAAWMTGLSTAPGAAILSVALSGIIVVALVEVGMRGGAIFAFAAVGLIADFVISQRWTIQSAPSTAIGFLPAGLAAAAVIVVLLRGAVVTRSLGAGAVVGIAFAATITLWPLPAVLGGYRLAQEATGEPLLIALVLLALAPALAVWLASRVIARNGLFRGAYGATLRDMSCRMFGLNAALWASLWAGSAADRALVGAVARTPLEGLATGVGWTVAIVSFGALVSAAIKLPEWLIREQLRGRCEAAAVGEIVGYAVAACAAVVVLLPFVGGLAIGPAAVLAIAAVGAYAWCRFRLATPARSPNVPLWILMPGPDATLLPKTAQWLAASWTVGQVTILTQPAIARGLRGEHLYAAARAGELDALFPTRAAHLADWDAAQPEAWVSMPVRELYAPPDIWPAIVNSRVEPSAHIVALVRPRESEPDVYDGWPGIGTKWISRSAAASIHPEIASAELSRMASSVAWGRRQSLIESQIRQPASAPLRTRRILLCPTPGRTGLAVALARALDGQWDSAGRRVEARVMPTAGIGNGVSPLAATFGAWRASASLIARLFEGSDPRAQGDLWKIYVLLVHLLTRSRFDTEFEIAVLESGGQKLQMGLGNELIANGLRRGVLARIVAIRVEGEGGQPLAFPPELYAGQLRVASDATVDAVARTVARRLLAGGLEPFGVTPVAKSPERDPDPTPPPPEPRDPFQGPPESWEVTERGGALVFRVPTDRDIPASVLGNADRQQAEQLLSDSMDGAVAQSREFDNDLFSQLIPPSFRQYVHHRRQLTLSVDEESAAFPWELVRDYVNPTELPFSLSTALLRRVIVPSDAVRARSYLGGDARAALIVGGPDRRRSASSSDSRVAIEAAMVADRLRGSYYDVVELEAEEATRDRLRAAFASRPWSVVHLSLQGIFETASAETRARRGLVLENGDVLTTADFSALKYAPEFVFIGCSRPPAAGRVFVPYYKLAAHLASHLWGLGARAVIAGGWPVNDDAADDFTMTFYREVMNGQPFVKAVSTARLQTFSRHPRTNTWGAYQCYGNPSTVLRTPPDGLR